MMAARAGSSAGGLVLARARCAGCVRVVQCHPVRIPSPEEGERQHLDAWVLIDPARRGHRTALRSPTRDARGCPPLAPACPPCS